MASDEKKDPTDVISFGPPQSGGEVPFVRTRQVESGTLIEAGTANLVPKDEEPRGEGEYLRMRHISDNHFEVVETLRSGPAKVNNSAYRSNWDTIFGTKQTVGQA